MKQLRKVLTKPRFTTEATATNLNFDQPSRSVTIGRENAANRGYIGRVCETSKGKNIFDSSVWLNTDFPSVIGVFGMRGTGKSFNLGIFAECLVGASDVYHGDIESPPAVVIFDVQNQFWTLAIEPTSENDENQLSMLSNWHISAKGLSNVNCWDPAGSESRIPNTQKYSISPSQLDKSDWLALLEQERYSAIGQALLELLRKNSDHTPKNLALNARTGGVLSSFQPQTVESLRWRLDSLAETDLINEPGVSIEDILVPGHISVVLLRNLPESLRALTVAIMTRLLASRMAKFHQQGKLAKRGLAPPVEKNFPQQLSIMLDEAHIIAPQEGKTPANAPLVDYVKRGRDSGLSLIFATQQPSAVDSKLMSQVDITFTHALGFETDVQAAIARMPTRKPSGYKCGGEVLSNPGDLIRTLKPGEALVADSANQRPFVVCMRPRLSVHGGDTPSQ